jgi:hypothetical protein
MGQLIYAPDTNTDQLKLAAVVTLIEQGRLAHNTQGDIACGDWERLRGKWQQYARQFRASMAPLYREAAILKSRIKDSMISRDEFRKLSDAEQFRFVAENLKPAPRESTRATFNLLENLKAVRVIELKDAGLVDPYEDWLNDYAEYDPFTKISIPDANTIDFTAQGTDTGYVRKEFGANHFGDLDHLFKSTFTSESVAGVYSCTHGHWNLTNTNTVVSIKNMIDAADGLSFAYYTQTGGSTRNVHIRDTENSTLDYYDLAPLSLPLTYYPRIERSGTGWTAKLYDDALRTSLVDTLTLTTSGTDYKYLYAVLPRGQSTNSGSMVTKLEDMDLQESSPVPPGGGGVATPGITVMLTSASGRQG